MKGVEVYRIRRVIGKGSFLEAHAGTALIARNDPPNLVNVARRFTVTEDNAGPEPPNIIYAGWSPPGERG